MAGVTHVEGDVTATFAISPLQGSKVVYRGTQREYATGNFLMIITNEISPTLGILLPARHRHRRLPDPLHHPRPLVLGERTGHVRRNTIIST